jgi:hypothetical protein
MFEPVPIKPHRKVSQPPKNDTTPPPAPMTYELLVQVTIPDKHVHQHGGKTKNKRQELIKKGIDMPWTTLLDQVAELLQTKVNNLIMGSWEWHWLKPASGAWLPMSDKHGLSSMVKQILTKAEPYIILHMHPPRVDSALALVSLSSI